MKRRYADGRRSRIERSTLKLLRDRNKELRWMLDGRDSKIRALEGRNCKVEKQNEELIRAVLHTSLAVKTRRFAVLDPRLGQVVHPTQRFELNVAFDFNGGAFPRLVVDEIPALYKATRVLQQILVDYCNEAPLQVATSDADTFRREHFGEFTDGTENRRPGMPFTPVETSDAFKRALREGRIL